MGDNVQSIGRTPGLVPAPVPAGLPDTVGQAVRQLNGKTLNVESPRQFEAAVKRIARRGRR